MKKTTLLKSMLLLCALVAGSGNLWAQVSTVTASNNGKYVIAYYANSKYYALPNNTSAAVWTGVEVTLNGEGKVSEEDAAGKTWILKAGSTTGQFYVTYEKSGTYYLFKNGTGATNYNIKGSTSDKNYWQFTLNGGSTAYTVSAVGRGTNNLNLGYAEVGKFGVYSSGADIILLPIDVEPVAVTGVALNKSATTIEEGKTETLTATISPANADNQDLTWVSDDEDVATVDNTGVVTAKNIGSARITVTTDDGGFTDYCDVTVIHAPAVAVTFDMSTNIFTFPSGSSNKTTSSNNYTYGTYTINLAGGGSGNGYYWNSDGYLIMGKEGCALTFPAFGFNVSKIKVYGTSGASESVKQNIYVGSSAVSTETTGAKNVVNEYAISAEKQTAGNIYILKVTSNHNTQISKIEIFGYQTVTVGSSKYASYCSSNALDFTDTDVKAYKAKVDEGKVVLTQVDEVPANEGIILYCDTPNDYNIPVAASASAVTENELIGVTSRTLVEWETGGDGKYNYILQQGAFKRAAAGGYLKANRAYLHTAYNVTSPGAHDLEMVFDGEQGDVTGIKNLISTTSKGEGVAYNLAGQRVNASHKGIVIVNGKKYLNK